MKEHRNLLERAVLAADLPAEPLPGLPLVEIAGTRRVLIENHCGVTVYGCREIRVKVSYGQICICGTKLELTKMTKHQLVITGNIDAVSLHKKGGR